MRLSSWPLITALGATSIVLVLLSLPAGTRLNMGAVSLCCGVAALTLMATAALLSSRWPAVESLFGGLDRLYITHKWLGIWALVFATVHLLFKAGAQGWETAPILALPPDITRFVRQLSFVGLMFILLLALNRTIAYSQWRWWHKLSGPLFVVVILHWLSFKTPITLDSPAGLWLAAWSVLGVAGALWKLVLYPWFSSHADYRVSAVTAGANAVQLELEPTGRRLRFKAGQFAFLRLHAEGLREPHPFTIAAAHDDSGRIAFVIRALGDYTRALTQRVKVGMRAEVFAPFGRFLRRSGAGREIWIGGGVGISPFIAWLKDRTAGSFDTVTLFYLYTPGRECPPIETLQALADAAGAGFVAVPDGPASPAFHDRFEALCRGADPQTLDIAVCGPRGLLAHVQGQARALGVPERCVRHEFFEFR